MRLLEYIKHSRSIAITADEARNGIEGKFNKAWKNNIKIYRGAVERNEIFLYIDPSSEKHEPRESANTVNYYTWIIDNSQRWKEYPKRSKSIICSTDVNMADNFGDIYRIFPIKDAKIGVCSSDDMWVSFKIPNTYSLDDFNDNISVIFNSNRLPTPSTWEKFKNSCDVVDEERRPIESNYPKKSYEDAYKFYEKFLGSNMGLLEYLDSLLDPKLNDFKLVKVGTPLPNNREVWISDPCIMVMNKENIVEMLMDGLLG